MSTSRLRGDDDRSQGDTEFKSIPTGVTDLVRPSYVSIRSLVATQATLTMLRENGDEMVELRKLMYVVFWERVVEVEGTKKLISNHKDDVSHV